MDPSHSFLVGSLDYLYRRTLAEKIRCFIIRKTSNGFQASQSSDASCYGSITSPTEGFLTFQFNSVKPAREVPFPRWTFQFDRLLSFDFTKSYEFNDDHTELTVSNISLINKNSTIIPKISVMEIVEAGADSVKMVLKTLTDCEQMYTCSILHRRTENILELEQGLPTRVLMAACADANFRSD